MQHFVERVKTFCGGIVFAPFRWVFSMPPVEDRPKIKNFLRYFIYMEYDGRYNETYVYYKVFMANLVMNIFFLSMYFLSFVQQMDIDLWLFTIRYRHGAPVDGLVYGYPQYVFPILAIVTIVYAALLFLLKTDYLSKDRIIREKEPILNKNKRLYEIKPLNFFLGAGILIGFGFLISGVQTFFPNFFWFLSDFEPSNYKVFLFYAGVYFILYQTFFCQLFTHITVYSIRSVLRHYVYHKDIQLLEKGNEHADDK